MSQDAIKADFGAPSKQSTAEHPELEVLAAIEVLGALVRSVQHQVAGIGELVHNVEAEQRALRDALLHAKRPHQVRMERRNAALCEIARASGATSRHAAACIMSRIFKGELAAPVGFELTVSKIMRTGEFPRNERTFDRILADYVWRD